jgi:hypothetical protein
VFVVGDGHGNANDQAPPEGSLTKPEEAVEHRCEHVVATAAEKSIEAGLR